MSLSLEIRIDDRVHERFPETIVGGFLVSGLEAASRAMPSGEELFSEPRVALDHLGINAETLASEPRIAAWRSAISSCGLKPSTYRCSPEQLARRILRGKKVVTPLAVVDNYCMVSVKHLSPLGAYDLDTLTGRAVVLRPGSPSTDEFQPLSGNKSDMPIDDQVIVYAEGDRVICWAFNHRDSSLTSLSADTTNAAFLGEAIDPSQHQSLRASLEELQLRLLEYGAHAGSVKLVDRRRPVVLLQL